MLRKLFHMIFPPSGQNNDTGAIGVVLAAWLILISGTTFLSLADAFQ